MSVIGVIGTGVIGTGWIARFLARGHEVKAWDPASGFAETLHREIDRLWPVLKRYGLNYAASPDNLECVSTLAAACADTGLVQESVPENLKIKQQVHTQLNQACESSTIIASSSSGLLPSDIQTVHDHPERMLIGHPFNPVYLLPLVEIVPGKHTSAKTVNRAKEFYRALNMHPLIVRKEIEGYLSDRLQEALWREILHLVNDGIATTEELDDAIIYGPGLRWAVMGTCLTFHLAGGKGGMQHMLEQFGPALKLPWTHLEAPELTDQLISRMVDGTEKQADGRSVTELEHLRDNCLIDIMNALERYKAGAGALVEKG